MRTSERPITETVVQVDEAEDDLAHLVCCRESWEKSLCGWDLRDQSAQMTTEVVCSMCAEEAAMLLERFGIALEDDAGRCVRDGTPCPTMEALEERVDRHRGGGGR